MRDADAILFKTLESLNLGVTVLDRETYRFLYTDKETSFVAFVQAVSKDAILPVGIQAILKVTPRVCRLSIFIDQMPSLPESLLVPLLTEFLELNSDVPFGRISLNPVPSGTHHLPFVETMWFRHEHAHELSLLVLDMSERFKALRELLGRAQMAMRNAQEKAGGRRE